jgi:hypothetical protein
MTARPRISAQAEALPAAWHSMQAQMGAGQTGDEARAHGVMLNVVVALLRRLSMNVLGHTTLGPVVYQLLDHSTAPGTIASQGSDHLLADGMTLWYSALKAVGAASGAGQAPQSGLSAELMALVQRLPDVMASNREPCKGLLILEAYVMLGGSDFMAAHGGAAGG